MLPDEELVVVRSSDGLSSEKCVVKRDEISGVLVDARLFRPGGCEACSGERSSKNDAVCFGDGPRFNEPVPVICKECNDKYLLDGKSAGCQECGSDVLFGRVCIKHVVYYSPWKDYTTIVYAVHNMVLVNAGDEVTAIPDDSARFIHGRTIHGIMGPQQWSFLDVAKGRTKIPDHILNTLGKVDAQYPGAIFYTDHPDCTPSAQYIFNRFGYF